MNRLFSYDFVFSNAPRTRLARHALFWGLWILFSTAIYLPLNVYSPRIFVAHAVAKSPPDFSAALLLTFCESVLFTLSSHLVFAYLLGYWLLPRFFYRQRWVWLILGFGAAILVQAFGAFIAGEIVSRPLRAWLGYPYRPAKLVIGLMAGIRGGMTAGGLFVAVVLLKNLFRQQETLLKTQREKLGAELQLLKAQVHPHFLFNTLNNLYALTRRQAPEAPDVVLRLSNLLSYVLYECNAPEVRLTQETDFLRNYVTLEKLRYGDRLEVSLNFTGDIPGQRIAPLLLIPFLENAFKHGTSEQLDQSWISLNLSVEGEMLTFQLLNSRDPEAQADPVGGIGLQNVRKRLELLYPDRHELRTQAEADSFLVTLRLTLDEGDETQRLAFQLEEPVLKS
jgi:hypothetical protein